MRRGRRPLAWASILAAGVFFLGLGRAAAAPLGCDVVTATECQITTLRDLGPGGSFEVDRTLHIGPAGELRTDPGSTLALDIAGSLTIDIGGKITGNAPTPSGRGATIAITATGPVLLAGNGTAGALITADQSGGSCSAGKGGSITLTSSFASSGESITLQGGSRVSVNARCSAGEIRIIATQGGVDIRGIVESASTLTGTGAKQPPGGGPITVWASCDLIVNDTGRVSSRGVDPGGDLVHLEAGGNVLVIGLVESTGRGHALPNFPANHCSGPDRPDKPLNTTACVEIWARKTLMIDATTTNRGEVNADTPLGVGRTAWIDLFAKRDIIINGAGSGPYAAGARPYAVHANQTASNSKGGTITAKSVKGEVSLGGQAIQADGPQVLGGAGGLVTIEAGGSASAGGDVKLGSASVRARGADVGGGPQAGGDIAVRSFSGHVAGEEPGELNATGGGGKLVPAPGTVTLKGCDAAPPAVSYGGASTPAAVVLAPGCGGKPSLPAYVVFPASACDVPPPCEGPDCPPEPCEGSDCAPYKYFCDKGSVKVVLDPVSGRFPGNVGPDVVVDLRTSSLQAAIDTASDTNNDGYVIIGVIGQDDGLPGGSGRQEIDVSQVYGKPFALIGCGVTLLDPVACNGRPTVHIRSSATSPEHPAGSGVRLYVQEISAIGSQSAPGWLVEGDGRFLEGIGSIMNAQGVKIVGNDNTIRHSVVATNLTGGIVVQGNGNTVAGVTSTGNSTGAGIQVTGSRNTIADNTAGDQGRGNGGAGISVNGQSNLIKNNGAFANFGGGITVAGGTAAGPNKVKNNVAGAPGRGNATHGIDLGGAGQGPSGMIDLAGNSAKSNGLVGLKVGGSGHRLKDNVSGSNGACQYQVGIGNWNATGNKSGGVLIGGADGSPFPVGCF